MDFSEIIKRKPAPGNSSTIRVMSPGDDHASEILKTRCVDMHTYRSRSLMDHMTLYEGDPEFYQSENPMMNQMQFEMQRKMGMDIDNMAYDMIFAEMQKRFSVKPTFIHECHDCGAHLELDNDKHIFHCPYCGAVYAIGIQMINAR